VTRLYFVRHGESEANVLKVISNRGSGHGPVFGHGLTDKGRRQAEELAENLRGSGAGAGRIFASPLLRAVQTAQVLSNALGVDWEVTEALREFDCGVAEGRSDPEAWELHRQVMDQWLQGQFAARIEQGESLLDVQRRFIPFVRALGETEVQGGAYILVGHGGLYLSVLPVLLVNLDPGSILHFPNAAFVLAETQPEGLVCLEWCGRPVFGRAATANGAPVS
jgi:broad specificity phosphatase PhoE